MFSLQSTPCLIISIFDRPTTSWYCLVLREVDSMVSATPRRAQPRLFCTRMRLDPKANTHLELPGDGTTGQGSPVVTVGPTRFLRADRALCRPSAHCIGSTLSEWTCLRCFASALIDAKSSICWFLIDINIEKPEVYIGDDFHRCRV